MVVIVSLRGSVLLTAFLTLVWVPLESHAELTAGVEQLKYQHIQKQQQQQQQQYEAHYEVQQPYEHLVQRQLEEAEGTDLLTSLTDNTVPNDATCTESCCQMVVDGDAATGNEETWIAEKGGVIMKQFGGPVGHEVVFKHLQRSSVNSGPSQYLNPGCFIEGYQYEFKMKYKLLNGIGVPYLCTTNSFGQIFSCPLFSLKLSMPDGTVGYEISVNQAEGQFSDTNAGTFKEYKTVFTANSDLVNAKSALLLVRGLPVHHVLMFDDVTLTPYEHSNAPHFDVNQFEEYINPTCNGGCCNLVRDGDAEVVVKVDNWDAIGGGMVDIFLQGPHGSTKSFRSFARQDIYVGPGQAINKNCLIPGQHYKFTAELMLQNTQGFYSCLTASWNEYGTCPLMSIGYRSLDGTLKWIICPNTHGVEIPGWVANKFNTYISIFQIPDDFDPTQVIDAFFMLRGPPPLSNIYFDDVSLVPYLHDPTEIIDPVVSCYTDTCQADMVSNGDLTDLDVSAWIPFGGGMFTTDLFHGVRHYGRPDEYSGPGQYIDAACLKPGRQFQVTANLRTMYPTGENYGCDLHSTWGELHMCPIFTISYTTTAGETLMLSALTQLMVVNYSAVTWNKYQVIFEIPADFEGATDVFWVWRGPPKNHIVQVKDVTFSPFCHHSEFTVAPTATLSNVPTDVASISMSPSTSMAPSTTQAPSTSAVPSSSIVPTLSMEPTVTVQPSSEPTVTASDIPTADPTVSTMPTISTLPSVEVVADEFAVSTIHANCAVMTCNPNFIVNGNAEASAYETIGWTPRLGGTLKVRSEGADGTFQSFEHSGRTSFIMGPKHGLPTECFIQGLRYQLDAKIKLLDENNLPFQCDKEHAWTEEYACPLLTFQLEMGHDNEGVIGVDDMKWLYYGNVAPGVWNANQWNNFKAYIDANDDIASATGGYLYIERPRAGVTMIVDEITVSRDCTTLVVNNNGETGSLAGWLPMHADDSSILIRTGGANGSQNAIAHVGRATYASGPGHWLDVGCLTEDTPYAFTARIKLLDETNNDVPYACDKNAPPNSPLSCPVFVIAYTLEDGTSHLLELPNEISHADQPWLADYFNPYLATFVISNELASATCAHMMLRGPRPDATIVFDDFTVAVNYPVVPDCGEKVIDIGDFDDGLFTGWKTVHGGQLDLVEEENGYSLKHSGGYNMMSGFSYQIPTLCIIEGKEYEIKVDMKLMDPSGSYIGCDKTAHYGAPNACPVVGVHFVTPTGTILHQPPNENAAPWIPDGCNSFYSHFTINAQMASAYAVFFSVWGTPNTVATIIDNVVFRTHRLFMHDCRQLVRNTNAESGVFTHWEVHGLGSLELTNGGYCSPHAFAHTGRTLPWMGPMQSLAVACLTEGLVYDVHAQLKLLDVDGNAVGCDKTAVWLAPNYCPILMFEEHSVAGETTHTHVANDYGAPWVADEFNAFRARVTLTAPMANAASLNMYFMGAGPNVTIVFDDVTMHQVTGGTPA